MNGQKRKKQFCPDIRYMDEDWFASSRHGHWGNRKQIGRLLQDIWQYPEAEQSVSVVNAAITVEERFHKLADEWSQSVGNISSLIRDDQASQISKRLFLSDGMLFHTC